MTAKRMSAALAFAAAAAIVAAAGLAARLVAGASAETTDIAPVVAPYRIDDAPSAGNFRSSSPRRYVAVGTFSAKRPRVSLPAC